MKRRFVFLLNVLNRSVHSFILCLYRIPSLIMARFRERVYSSIPTTQNAVMFLSHCSLYLKRANFKLTRQDCRLKLVSRVCKHRHNGELVRHEVPAGRTDSSQSHSGVTINRPFRGWF